MTDRELLELAAKAAGLTEPGWVLLRESGEWDPLADDGDALRLAVKLAIGVQSYAALGYSHAGTETIARSVVIKQQHNGDPCAATRRAIVRAAAEIGKAMP